MGQCISSSSRKTSNKSNAVVADEEENYEKIGKDYDAGKGAEQKKQFLSENNFTKVEKGIESENDEASDGDEGSTYQVKAFNLLYGDKLAAEKAIKELNVDEIEPFSKPKKFHEAYKELIDEYIKEDGESVDMSIPRDTIFVQATSAKHPSVTSRIGQDVSLSSIFNNVSSGKDGEIFDKYSYRSMSTEVRGITIRQLKAIIPLIKRRCTRENWTRPVYKNNIRTEKIQRITVENATLHDVNTYVIKPFTEYSQKSFVETLPSTKGTQPPRWFISHCWGENFIHTVACLEKLMEDFCENKNESDNKRGGGMTEDTPVWICAFANNQHRLDDEITEDPADSAFAKAMQIADFRIVSIQDLKEDVYTRIWCIYELYLALILPKNPGIEGLLAVYTYINKSAIGLIEGGGTSKKWRLDDEKYFPRDSLFNALRICIQEANASDPVDKKHILNAIVGRKDLEMEFDHLAEHENYEKLNSAVRGKFASSIFALEYLHRTVRWDECKIAMRHSITKVFTLDFHEINISSEAAIDILRHLPNGLAHLKIVSCPYGRKAIEALLDWLHNYSTNLKILSIIDTSIGGEVGGKECGELLSRFLASNNCQLEELDLIRTDLIGSRNVKKWSQNFKTNRTLKRVKLSGRSRQVDEDEDDEALRALMVELGEEEEEKMYFDGSTFPDSTLSKEQGDTLRAAINSDQIEIDNFIHEA